MDSFKTKAGTILPLLDLRGKKYLQVMHRIVWFREEKPEWAIETEPVRLEDTFSIFKAIVRNEQGRIIATGHQREDQKHFPDHLAKAETAAIGRALAACGYGTQFAPELDEEDRLADSPVPSKKPQQKPNAEATNDPGEFVIPFGSTKGKKLMELNGKELDDMVRWFKGMKEPPKGSAAHLETALNEYLNGK